MTLAPTVAARIAKLLPLLSSDKPGEVAGTVYAIERTLKAANRDWRSVAQWCARHADLLSERELDFISNMARRRTRAPTEAQLKWLLAIERRLRRQEVV